MQLLLIYRRCGRRFVPPPDHRPTPPHQGLEDHLAGEVHLLPGPSELHRPCGGAPGAGRGVVGAEGRSTPCPPHQLLMMTPVDEPDYAVLRNRGKQMPQGKTKHIKL